MTTSIAPDIAVSAPAAPPRSSGPVDVQRVVVWALTVLCSASIAINGFFLRETVRQLQLLQANEKQHAIAIAVLQERTQALVNPQPPRSRK